MLSCSLLDNDVKFNLFRLFYVIIAIYYFFIHTLKTTTKRERRAVSQVDYINCSPPYYIAAFLNVKQRHEVFSYIRCSI